MSSTKIYILKDREDKALKAIGKSLAELRSDDKKDKKKKEKKQGKSKPFINPNNKILLPNREEIVDKIRQGNRTAILLNKEFEV